MYFVECFKQFAEPIIHFVIAYETQSVFLLKQNRNHYNFLCKTAILVTLHSSTISTKRGGI